ncbi:MAG: hypothetical protein ACI4VE_05195 [Clostridia bacterium]
MKIEQMLLMVLMILIFLISVLVYVYWLIQRKNKKDNNSVSKIETNGDRKTKNKENNYTKLSISNFMEFDKIEDNMIIQDNGTRYLMVVECEGINYDLMSNVEKTGVEAGFVQFLNTLRHPIQIYTQTRTIKIESSIERYKARLEEIKKDVDKKQKEYLKLKQSYNATQNQIQVALTEFLRVQNMYDYTRDIIANIEAISQNKNVLRKHYYIIVPYYSSEVEVDSLNEDEKKNIIFSELYTRAQSIIRTLFACSMKCRILDSKELAELLYVAYNRDESETFGIDKALEAHYDDLYVTAPDVLDKRINSLNKEIEKKAFQLAQDTINEIKTEKEIVLRRKEQSFDDLIKEMAEALLKENKKYVGKEITEEAIERIKTKEEGGLKNEKKKTTRKTRKTV